MGSMSTDTPSTGYPPLSDLRRSRSDRKVAGVAGGLGRYAGVDPLVFRILFVVLAIFGGSGILLYGLGWLLVPEDGETESEGRRLVNGRSTSSAASALALVVVLAVGVVATGATIGSGPGLGGVGVLVVVAVLAVLLLRDGRRTPAGRPSPTGAAPAMAPPSEPGAYGQTTGTAYSASAAPAPAFPAPPGTPGHPAYSPVPPPPPPPVPRERSVLGRATLSVALIVVGVLVGWNLATDSDLRPAVVISAALAVVAGGLVVGAFAGRARGLVVWAGLLALLAAGASVSHAPLRAGVGDRTWAPRTVEQLRPAYRLGVGDGELDLSRIDFAAAGRQRVQVRQGIGDLLVVVPAGVVVRIDADVDAGEIRLPGRAPSDGTGLRERMVVPEGSSPSAAALVVDARLGLGSLEVRRAAS